MIELKVRTAGTIKDLDKFKQVIRAGIHAGLEDVGLFGEKTIKTKYLMGPKPLYLRVDTGALRNGIRYRIAKKGNGETVFFGTNVVSPKGFNYPGYWETDGSRHGGPRPFLKPLVDLRKHDIREIFLKTVKQEIIRGMG